MAELDVAWRKEKEEMDAAWRKEREEMYVAERKEREEMYTSWKEAVKKLQEALDASRGKQLAEQGAALGDVLLEITNELVRDPERREELVRDIRANMMDDV